MTKKEWLNIKIGTKVKTDLSAVIKGNNGNELRKVTLYGKIVQINSNGSQVKVRWEDGIEIWYGRLGLELVKPQP